MEMKYHILLAISGLSASGKTFFIDALLKKGNFSPLPSVTTRPPRINEIEGVDKFFVNDEIFELMNKNKELICVSDMAGYRYGTKLKYAKSNIKNVNLLGQYRYDNFKELKKYIDVVSIYIYPKSIDKLINKILERKLSKNEKNRRISIIKDELYNVKLLKKKGGIDYYFTNNYDEKSVVNFFDLIIRIEMEQNLILIPKKPNK